MRLIDADEIKYTDMLFSTGNGNYEHVGMVTQYEIDALPTVDAVPVIRCKDCAWYVGGFFCENLETVYMHENDHCSLAKRKEE